MSLTKINKIKKIEMKTEIYPLLGSVGSIKNGNLDLRKTSPQDFFHLIEKSLCESKTFLSGIQISFGENNKIMVWINRRIDGKIVTTLNKIIEYHDFLEKIEKI